MTPGQAARRRLQRHAGRVCPLPHNQTAAAPREAGAHLRPSAASRPRLGQVHLPLPTRQHGDSGSRHGLASVQLNAAQHEGPNTDSPPGNLRAAGPSHRGRGSERHTEPCGEACLPRQGGPKASQRLLTQRARTLLTCCGSAGQGLARAAFPWGSPARTDRAAAARQERDQPSPQRTVRQHLCRASAGAGTPSALGCLCLRTPDAAPGQRLAP